MPLSSCMRLPFLSHLCSDCVPEWGRNFSWAELLMLWSHQSAVNERGQRSEEGGGEMREYDWSSCWLIFTETKNYDSFSFSLFEKHENIPFRKFNHFTYAALLSIYDPYVSIFNITPVICLLDYDWLQNRDVTRSHRCVQVFSDCKLRDTGKWFVCHFVVIYLFIHLSCLLSVMLVTTWNSPLSCSSVWCTWCSSSVRLVW